MPNRLPFFAYCVVGVLVAACVAGGGVATAQSPGEMLGGGNILVSRGLTEANARFEILNTIGASWCRIPVPPNHYGPEPDRRPRPELYDDLVLSAYRHGIRPMFLFEFYTRWHGSLDDYDWPAVGRAFAERFAPDSDWLRGHGIDGWGIEFYTAINEPMWKENNPTPIPVEEYVRALEGLADGVHSVDRSLKVSPGGYQEIPLLRDNIYGPAVAHLYNMGKLYSIDIHRYYDVKWQPMYGTYRNSLQNQFDEVKKQWGITADIRFHTTEFNFKKREVSEEEAAAGFLTAIWDALGIVGNDNQPVTDFAMPWNVFHSPTADAEYGMCLQASPWEGTARGKTLQQVCRLTEGMQWIECDPRNRGVFVLAGGGRKLWVWQNRRGWTDRPGTSFELTEIPPEASRLEVYGWNGLRRSERLIPGQNAITINDLPTEETLMLLAR